MYNTNVCCCPCHTKSTGSTAAALEGDIYTSEHVYFGTVYTYVNVCIQSAAVSATVAAAGGVRCYPAVVAAAAAAAAAVRHRTPATRCVLPSCSSIYRIFLYLERTYQVF